MEQRHLVMSALGVGLGVGVGLGLASGQTVGKWAGLQQDRGAAASAPEKIEQELARQVVDGKDSKVTFDEFPYYLRTYFRCRVVSCSYGYRAEFLSCVEEWGRQ